jgi:myo-inositol-1(or 4)-monophosphatase
VHEAVHVATETARAVGAVLRTKWSLPSQVQQKKSAVDLVTDADLEAERVAVARLREAFPDHTIVAEETLAQVEPRGYCWYVDPLDGTTNFAHRYPHFAVSIALAHEGELVVGVVFDPLREELFAASRGRGATLNGQTIRVSDTPTLDRALLATGFPYDRRVRAPFYLRTVEQVLTRCQGIRRAGAAALDLCYVASGRLDGFWEWYLRPWDTAAGGLIVQEAGGTLSDFSGQPHELTGPQIAASNTAIHGELVATVGGSLPPGGA